MGLETRPFDVHGDSIYSLEPINSYTGSILAKAAKLNGSWLRTRALGYLYQRIVFVGERYFLEAQEAISTATLDGTSPLIELLDKGPQLGHDLGRQRRHPVLERRAAHLQATDPNALSDSRSPAPPLVFACERR